MKPDKIPPIVAKEFGNPDAEFTLERSMEGINPVDHIKVLIRGYVAGTWVPQGGEWVFNSATGEFIANTELQAKVHQKANTEFPL